MSENELITANRNKPELWAGQGWLLNDRQAPEHLIVSGVGYGKTQFGARWHFLRASNFNRQCEYSYIGAPKEGLLKHGILPRYVEHLDDVGLSASKPFSDYKITTSSGGMSIKFSWGHTAILQTMHESAARSVVSVTAGFAWVDECGLTSEITPIEMSKRVRDPKATAMQKLYTGTPEGITGWYAAKLLDEQLKRKGRFSVGNRKVVLHGNSKDNKYLTKEYFDAMYAEFGYDENLIRAYIKGEVVPIYQANGYDFDAEIHQGNFKTDPSIPLHLGFDFNVLMVSWAGVQEYYSDLIAVAENKKPARTTNEACYEFIEQFPPEIWSNTEIIIHGDAAGQSRDTRQYGNDYDIIKSILKPKYPLLRLKIRKANPSVGLRVACVNRLFNAGYTKSSLYISRQCNKTADSLRTTTIDKNGNIEKPNGDTVTHRSDALGYIVVDLRPMRKPKPGHVPAAIR